MLTQFRLAALGAVALCGVWAGQASAFWPFGDAARLSLAPAYGGVCEECDLSGRILAGAKMSDSVFNGSNFTSAVLARADATGSEFAGADFTDADLSGAKLVESLCPQATFERANLSHSDGSGANFSRANFAQADVTRMNFDGANISGADLRHAYGLSQAQLDEACGDASTRLPRGLRVARCE